MDPRPPPNQSRRIEMLLWIDSGRENWDSHNRLGGPRPPLAAGGPIQRARCRAVWPGAVARRASEHCTCCCFVIDGGRRPVINSLCRLQTAIHSRRVDRVISQLTFSVESLLNIPTPSHTPLHRQGTRFVAAVQTQRQAAIVRQTSGDARPGLGSSSGHSSQRSSSSSNEGRRPGGGGIALS